MQFEREEKPPWSVVPARVKEAVAQALSAPVVRATRSYGGYAPSATFRLTLADGGRAFIKATFPLPEGSAVRWSLDREEVIYRRLGSVIQAGRCRVEGSCARMASRIASGSGVWPSRSSR